MPHAPGAGGAIARGLALACLLLGALAASGCALPGGAESSPGEDELRAAVTEAFTTDRPSSCETLATERFLVQTTGERDPGRALAECRQDADGEPDGETVRFERLVIEGREAEVVVDVLGGDTGGVTIAMDWRVEDDAWKADRVTDFQLDRNRFRDAMRSTLVEQGFPRSEAACSVRKMLRNGDAIRQAVLTGDHGAVEGLGAECLSPETVRRGIASGIRENAGDAPPQFVHCLIDTFQGMLSDEDVLRLNEGKDSKRYHALADAAAKACAPDASPG